MKFLKQEEKYKKEISEACEFLNCLQKITNFKNTFLINNYIEIKKYLGPHGSYIFYELTEAIKNNNYLTIIILSATLIDVIKNEKTDIINSLVV